MKKIICLLVLVVGFTANVFAAESITVNWVAPTTRANNAPLPLDEIQGFELYRCGQPAPFIVLPGSATEYVDPVAEGETEYCYQLATVDTNGIRSALSNPASVSLAAPSATSLGITVRASVTFDVTGVR